MILTDEQRMVRDMARSFAREQLAPQAALNDREHRFPAEALKAMGALGLLGMLVPGEWDGAGTDHVAYALALEEVAAGEGATSTIMIEAARHLVLHAASLRDAVRPCLREASMAKLFASEMAEKVCSDAIQVHGGYGYVEDFPVERIYRDVRVCQIYEGTSDIQRLVIARQLEPQE